MIFRSLPKLYKALMILEKKHVHLGVIRKYFGLAEQKWKPNKYQEGQLLGSSEGEQMLK